MSITSINTFQGNSIAGDYPSNRMDCSSDGQHIIVFASKRDNRFEKQSLADHNISQIFISNDFGQTFREQYEFGTGGDYKNLYDTNQGYLRWQVCSCRCDSTGQYMLTLIHSGSMSYNFYYSSDYGTTWQVLFNTGGTLNNEIAEHFAISEPISGAITTFPCYVAVEWRGQIWVWSPLTNTRTGYSSNIKLNDISMSSDGSKIVFAGRNQVCKFSTDFGVNWTDVPTLTKGACCSLVDNQIIVVDYDSGTKNIEYSNDSGSTWSSSQITLTENFHEASIGENKIVLSGENGVLYSSNDGLTWIEETSGLSDLLNGLVSYTNGFYLLNSPISGLRSFHSLVFSSSGGQENTTEQQSSIIFNTPSLVNRVHTSISDSSTMSFTLYLENDYDFYSLVLLHNESFDGYPLFYGNLYSSSNGSLIVPISSIRIVSHTLENNILTFTLEGNYTGNFTFSYVKHS